MHSYTLRLMLFAAHVATGGVGALMMLLLITPGVFNRFCLHPRVKTSKSKAEACELATVVGRGEGCTFLDHAESIGSAPHTGYYLPNW